MLFSGKRTGEQDINHLSLGYYGDGPHAAMYFLGEAGFPLAIEAIAKIEPGDVIKLRDGSPVVRKHVASSEDTTPMRDNQN